MRHFVHRCFALPRAASRVVASAVLAVLALSLIFVPGCVASKSKDRKSLQQYELSEAPNGITKNEIRFEDKVTLLGYQVSPKGRVKPGTKLNVTMYWRVDKEIGEKGWKLFTHVLDGAGKRLLNIDNVGPLRQYKGGDQALPPSDWKAGKVYQDEQSFVIPKKTKTRTIQVTTGIWKGKQRLKIKSGKKTRDDRGIAAEIPIDLGKKRATSTRVPRLRVDKLEAPAKLKIDGKLDEPEWKEAADTGPFIDVATGEKNEKFPVNGRAKLLYDDTNLYIGFTVEDIDVTGGFDPKTPHPHLWTKDTVEIMVDPDGDGDNRDYYEIQVNPQNLVFDSRFDSYNQPKDEKKEIFGHQDWSAKLKSAVSIDGTIDDKKDKDKGYTVEIQIPWKSFDKAKQVPPEPGSTWRINLYAMENNGGVAWSPILRQGNFHKASRFGKVLFATKDWSAVKKLKSSDDKEDEKGKPAASTKAVGAAGAPSRKIQISKRAELLKGAAGTKTKTLDLDKSKLKPLPKPSGSAP